MTLALAWAAVAAAAAGLAYRWRHRVLRLCVLVPATATALGATAVLSGDIAQHLANEAATMTVASVVLSVLAVLLIARGLPPLVSRRDRPGVAVVCGALAAMYIAVAVFLALAALDGMRVAELPRVRTRDEFIAARDAPSAGGVLLEGRISALSRTLQQDSDVVASHSCLTLGPLRIAVPGNRLPDRYLVEFPGGPPVPVEGIDSGARAWRWPSGSSVDTDAGQCVLRRGDAVVVWGDLQRSMGGGDTSQTGLADVRVIGVGDLESFLTGYVPAAERTGRAVLALATGNAALAAIVTAVAVRTVRRLTRCGTDDPPRITWQTGPR